LSLSFSDLYSLELNILKNPLLELFQKMVQKVYPDDVIAVTFLINWHSKSSSLVSGKKM